MVKKYIPNILTFSNLSLGILSIIMVMNKNYLLSALFILGGALVDRYDGRIARALDVSSEIGMQLDSLADLISFGVAPALLILYRHELNNHFIGLCVMMFYILCGCYRLAKYNITVFEGEFSGVPITVCGCAMALLSLIHINVKYIPVLFMILFGYLMISKLKIKKI